MPRLPSAVAALLAAGIAGAPGGSVAGRHPELAAPADGCGGTACHGGLAGAPAGGSAHEPATQGNCGACHDLALGAAPYLRAGAGEQGGDGPLCAGCHEAHAASGSDSSVRTAFADGARDLHGVHVRAAGRGRVCLGCHDPHAAAQPRLLRAVIPGGASLRITQRFEARPDGGRCTTRCHAPKTYRDGRR